MRTYKRVSVKIGESINTTDDTRTLMRMDIEPNNGTYGGGDVSGAYVANIFYTTFSASRGGLFADNSHVFVQLD
jgi:hypothetical protein